MRGASANSGGSSRATGRGAFEKVLCHNDKAARRPLFFFGARRAQRISGGSVPPLAAMRVITCLCSQMFHSAEPGSALPV